MAESSTRNRLAAEKSPYLLQHADNPVDWYPWGEEAFRRAREEDRPVFLSIGYSTCHWCHVMAHESFEDPGVAELLNEHFVSVKVDREERPDVDGVYMTACQMMTGRGGWPLTIVTTPDRRPFFAGTYFPKEGRGGRPGLTQILRRIAELWETERERVLESARRATSALAEGVEGEPGSELGGDTLEEAYRQLAGTFDGARGGFGQAPKFPTPHNLLFLLRHWDRTGEERAREMACSTLDAMRRGGIYDHVGFGFHRYSTDERWLLPHFEKMLYDQALLALAYLEAHQATGKEAYARTAREIFAYVLRDMRDPDGGFHSAEDADSEGGEGAFYVWSLEELDRLLDPDELELVREAYGVRPEGNYVEEATGERTGDNILHLTRPRDELAEAEGVTGEELDARLETIREKLFRARAERPRPHKDDKVLTDWNGLMIGALARGGAVLGEERYLEAAREAADFLLEELREEEGRLLHRWREGEAAVPATASDYAFLVFGLVELYEASFAPRWLAEAVRLDRESVERCWDEDRGGFFTSAEDVTDLPVRQKEVHDGALPSANSVAHWNALRLDRLTGGTEREERALSLERAFGGRVERAPGAHTAFMVGLDFRVGEGHEVVLTGERDAPELEEMLRVLRRSFWPRTVVLFRPTPEAGEEEGPGAGGGAAPAEATDGDLRELAPFVREQTPLEGRPTAYVCTDFACREPTTDPGEMRRQLEARAGG